MSVNIQATASGLQPLITQYTQDIVTMYQYASAVASSQLPTLSDFEIIDPQDYNNYTQQYTNMISSAITWNTQVQPNLNNVIGSISNASALVTDEFGDAISAAQLLQANPADSGALSDLNQNLTTVSNNLNNLITFLKTTSGLVTTNQGIISDNSAALANITSDIQDMLTAANNDVSSIQNSINSMTNEISNLNSQIDFDKVVEVGGVIAAVVGFVLTFTGNPIAGGLIFLGGIAAADIEGQLITTEQQAIASLQSQVNNLQGELTNDKAAYTAAEGASTTVASLSNQIGQILQKGSPMQQIENFLGTALDDLQQIEQSVQTAQKEEGNWAEVISDLQSAQNEWNTIQQYLSNAGSFTIVSSQNVVIQANA